MESCKAVGGIWLCVKHGVRKMGRLAEGSHLDREEQKTGIRPKKRTSGDGLKGANCGQRHLKPELKIP